MALIVWPVQDSDSFVTVAQATLYAEMLTMNSVAWKALSIEDQERLLRIAYKDIVDHTDPTTYPTPLPACVGEAQSLMAVHDMVNSISSGAADTGIQVKKNKAGPIEQEFFESKTAKRSLSRVPEQAKKCLEDFGYVFVVNSSKFTQKRVGRM